MQIHLIFGAQANPAGIWHAPRSATIRRALGDAPLDDQLVSRRAKVILRSRARRQVRAAAVDESGHYSANRMAERDPSLV